MIISVRRGCFNLHMILAATMFLAGCASLSDSNPALSQQAEADYVLNFQSWNTMSFIKPDITGTATGMSVKPKTFTAEAVVKLLNNMKRPRRFVVVVLDRRHSPDPVEAEGGMDAIQKFFMDLGFKRVAFQDGSGWDRTNGYAILRDSAARKSK